MTRLIVMLSEFVCTERVPSLAMLVTEGTHVAGGVGMDGLHVLIDIGFDLGHLATLVALPA